MSGGLPRTTPNDDLEVENLDLRGALKFICTTNDSGPWIEVYRSAGGGYEGLQAVAAAALEFRCVSPTSVERGQALSAKDNPPATDDGSGDADLTDRQPGQKTGIGKENVVSNNDHYRVTELFQDGTVAAENSDGKERFFGLCVEDDGGPNPNLYLCRRRWQDEPNPPPDWRRVNSLTRFVEPNIGSTSDHP